jgi:Peptidase_C39 like family
MGWACVEGTDVNRRRISRIAATARAAAVAICVGLAAFSGTSVALTAPAVADPTGMYGDPAKAAQYWAEQSFGNNCVLMSVASVVGQITGQMPTEQQIIEVAKTTPSVAEAGKPVYGDTNGDGADTRDISVLLAHYGIHATTSDEAQGAAALTDLETALRSRHAVLVPVSSGTIWNGDKPKDGDHEVVVTGVDASNGVVHLNDSGAEDGRDEQVPIATFIKAWGGGDFEMTVSQETVQ